MINDTKDNLPKEMMKLLVHLEKQSEFLHILQFQSQKITWTVPFVSKELFIYFFALLDSWEETQTFTVAVSNFDKGHVTLHSGRSWALVKMTPVLNQT